MTPAHEYAVNSFALADLDRDGIEELVWGGSHLSMLDLASRELDWSNVLHDGPWVGPAEGDLDGDGRPEIVVSPTTDSATGTGRVLALRGPDLGLIAMSEPIGSGVGYLEASDITTHDLDGDGADEVIVSMDIGYEATLEVYRFSNGAFELVRQLVDGESGAWFESVDVADVDGDDRLELVTTLGRGAGPSGPDGIFLVVYDLETFVEEWRSWSLGSYFLNRTLDVAIGNIDNDAEAEILVLLEQPGEVEVFGGDGGHEGSIAGSHTALALAPGEGNRQRILLGDGSGDLRTYRYAFGDYRLARLEHLADEPIDGITVGAAGSIWVGSGGSLGHYLARPGGFLERWRSDRFGSVFGRRVVFPSTSRRDAVTGGSYSIRRLEAADGAAAR